MRRATFIFLGPRSMQWGYGKIFKIIQKKQCVLYVSSLSIGVQNLSAKTGIRSEMHKLQKHGILSLTTLALSFFFANLSSEKSLPGFTLYAESKTLKQQCLVIIVMKVNLKFEELFGLCCPQVRTDEQIPKRFKKLFMLQIVEFVYDWIFWSHILPSNYYFIFYDFVEISKLLRYFQNPSQNCSYLVFIVGQSCP